MTAARKPSAASIERALVEWYRAEVAWGDTPTGSDHYSNAVRRVDIAKIKVKRIAARIAAGRRGK
jgi:hypothetical protein